MPIVWIVTTLIALALLAAAAYAVRQARARRRPDPALRIQTPVQKFSGYDQARAVAGRLRWLSQSPSGRPWRRTRELRQLERLARTAQQIEREQKARRPIEFAVRVRKEGSGS